MQFSLGPNSRTGCHTPRLVSDDADDTRTFARTTSSLTYTARRVLEHEIERRAYEEEPEDGGEQRRADGPAGLEADPDVGGRHDRAHEPADHDRPHRQLVRRVAARQLITIIIIIIIIIIATVWWWLTSSTATGGRGGIHSRWQVMRERERQPTTTSTTTTTTASIRSLLAHCRIIIFIMGKRDKRKAAAKKKGVERSHAKSQSKAGKKSEKQSRRQGDPDDDLDALLAEFKRQDDAQKEVKRETIGRPGIPPPAEPSRPRARAYRATDALATRWHRAARQLLVGRAPARDAEEEPRAHHVRRRAVRQHQGRLDLLSRRLSVCC